MKKTKLILPITMILSLILTACAGEHNTIENEPIVNTTAQESKVPNADATRQESRVTLYEEVTLTFTDAFKIYTERFPDTKIEKVELEKEGKTYIYKVEGYDIDNEYEIKIHPISGEILKESMETDDDNKGDLTTTHTDKVEGIISKALTEAGEGAIVREVTLKSKQDRVEVQVEIEKEGLEDVEYKYDIEGNLLEID